MVWSLLNIYHLLIRIQFMDLRKEAKSIESKLIEYRRQIHMNPELGFEEYKTSEYICKVLDNQGIEYRNKIAKTGVVATIKGNGEGRRIMIRADMDALPLQEENDVPYKSKIDGKMHACGHDAHVACLLGAAELLNNHKDEFKGIVDLLFQPAEEGPGGAVPMIQEGAIGDSSKPHIDAALALHVAVMKESGYIGVKDGPISGSADEIFVTVMGKGGHASAPHLTTDPVFVAMQIGIAIQGWLSRMFDPVQPRVITFGKIHGGSRNNIIGTSCKMDGTLRTLNEELRESIKSKLPGFVSSVAETYGSTAVTEIKTGYGVGVNAKEINDHIRKTYSDLFGKEKIIEIENPGLGAEDFFDFSLKGKIPVAMFRLDTRNEERGIISQNHSSTRDIDEDALHIGAATLAGTAMSFLNSK